MTTDTTLAEIGLLFPKARARTDAAAHIDPAQAVFLARIGGLEAQVDACAVSPAEAAKQRVRLIIEHARMLRTIVEVPEAQLPALLWPNAPTVAMSRAAQAADVIHEAKGGGVVLTSPAPGVVEAAPSAKLTAGLRQMIGDLRAELSELLRSGIEVFAA